MKKFKFTFISGLLVLLVVFFTWWNNQDRPVGESLVQPGDKTPSVITTPHQKDQPLPPSVISSTNPPPAVVQEKPVVQTKSEEKPAQTFSYKGVDGKNALELLKANHKVETKNFSGLGEYVEVIDSTKPDSKHFWKFFINGKSATVGASSYMTNNGDMIEWKIDKIGNE